MVKYAVRMANRAKAQTEQDLLTLGDLTDRDAAEDEIEGQYRRVAKDVAEYENWLTQAYLADERYVSETSALLRDSTLPTSVLNLTLTPGGIPVSAATYDAWKQHGATLGEQLRKSDARLATAQKLVRATQLAGAVAGIASGGIETAAAEGVKEAGKYVAKEVAKLLLWEAVDYVLEKMAANGGTGAEVAERIQRARIAYFILRARGGRFSGRLGATSGKNPKKGGAGGKPRGGLLSEVGKVRGADIVKNLKGKSFADKVTTMRAMLQEAKKANPSFRWVEYIGENAEAVFVGEGIGIKNVVSISRSGTITRSTLEGIERVGTEFPRLVKILSGRGNPEILVP